VILGEEGGVLGLTEDIEVGVEFGEAGLEVAYFHGRLHLARFR
jgi:hypothetical protein